MDKNTARAFGFRCDSLDEPIFQAIFTADAPDFDRLTKSEYLILIQLVANALDEANSLQLSCHTFNDSLKPLVDWMIQLTTEGKISLLQELIESFTGDSQ
jgi:hypothetical protein